MGLHIEISGDLDRREWQGVKALAMIMLGEVSADALTRETIEAGPMEARIETIARAPEPAPVPTPPAAVVPAPPVAEAAPVPPAPSIDPGAVPPSESLMAAAAQAAAAAVAAGAELDSAGFPWDARIHAGTKSTKKDGTWTYKRGVDDALVKAVEAELRAVMAAPTAATVPSAPETPPAPPLGVTDPAAAFGGGAPASSPASVPAPPSEGAATQAPPAPPVAPSPADTPSAPTGEAGASPEAIGEFARVMRVVVGKQTAGTLSTELTTRIAQQLGLTGVRDLARRPDLIPAFEALLP